MRTLPLAAASLAMAMLAGCGDIGPEPYANDRPTQVFTLPIGTGGLGQTDMRASGICSTSSGQRAFRTAATAADATYACRGPTSSRRD